MEKVPYTLGMEPDRLKMVRARKVVDNGTGPFAVPLAQLTESIITNVKLDQLTEAIKGMEMPEAQDIEIPEFPSEITVSNLPEVQKVEMVNSGLEFANMLFKSLKGEKGDPYVLTEKDKKDIVSKLKVVKEERIIVKEPVITNEIKEVAIYEEAEQIAEKLNTLEAQVELSVLKGWKDFVSNLGEKTSATRVYGTRMLRNLVDVIGAKEATDGQVLTKQADGTFAFETPSGGGASLTVQDIDGTPTVTNVTAIKFTNGAVTDNGDGTVNVSTSGSGGGDVSSNTGVAVDSEIALFSGTTGKIIKRATTTGILKGTSGVISAATADTDYLTPGTAATTYQPLDSDLTTVAGLSASNDDFIQRKAGAWSNRTVAQVKTDLGLTGTNSGDQTITLTGGVTGSGTGSFAATVVTNANLTGDVTSVGNATTLATVNSNVGSFTNASLTVNAKGLITAASSGTAPVTSVGATGPITSSGGATPTISTSMATNKLIGRGTAGTGVFEEITLGTNLSLSGTTLNATGGGGLSDGDYGDITVSGSGTVMNIDAAVVGVTELSASGTPSSSTFLRGDNTWATPAGSGTVTNTGGNLTANSVVLGAGTTDTKVVAGITTDGTSQINLGVNATTLGKAKFFGNTSGDVTLQPNAVAGTGVVLTLPATTGTLVTGGGTASGTNTGDQTSIVGITGTMAQFDTAVSDGNIVYQSQALGTPASGTLTNCTGLPVSGITASTVTALGVGSLEIGHASDTTLSRVSAGVAAIEGNNILTSATGQPLDATLTALAAYNTNGILTQTAADTFTGRTITGTSNQIDISNGNGVSGNPTLSLATNARIAQITMIIGDGVNAISANATSFPIPCTFAGTITAYSISVDAGTCTMKTWKKATGTAIPTSGDSISTSGVSISTGTHVRSSTVSDFTSTTVTANDILIATCTSVATAKYIVFTLEITKS